MDVGTIRRQAAAEAVQHVGVEQNLNLSGRNIRRFSKISACRSGSNWLTGDTTPAARAWSSPNQRAAHSFAGSGAVSLQCYASWDCPGPFRIVRLLPLSESGVPQYRAVSIADGHDRVLPETAMRLLPAAANSNTEAPVRKTWRSSVSAPDSL
jgi:hypothetical protein